jgi:tripartite-type tricarboxylate transporter receptor subunit TctC
MKFPHPKVTLSIPVVVFFYLVSGFALLVAIHGDNAWSQISRTIKLVVPVPAGGPQDAVARLLAEQIGQLHGPTIVVENRPGAANLIATEVVARAAPDGTTLLVHAATLLISPQLRKLDYDPFTSFEPICRLLDSPMVVVVNSASPYRTLGDLVAGARIKPGDLTLASVGPGTPHQIAFELFKRAANIDMIYVPYPGDAPAVNALLGQQLTSMITALSSVASFNLSGQLRILATTSGTRLAAIPHVPTIAELGYGNVDISPWYGTLAPAGTPKETISELIGWFTRALQAPTLRAKLLAQQFVPVGQCGADYADFLQRQNDEYGRVIREAGIKAD